MPQWIRLFYLRMQSYAILNFILGGVFGWALQEGAMQFSQQQRWLGIVGIGLFVVLAFAVAPPFDAYLRTLFAPAIPLMGEKPTPRRGLILLLGNEPTVFCAIDHHKERLQLIMCVVTDFMEERYNRLKPQLEARGFSLHPVFMNDAYNQREAAVAVESCLTWARHKELTIDDLICDVTGGTSIMSIGAAFQCQRQGVQVQVVRARQTEKGPTPLHPVLIRLDAIEPAKQADR